MTQATRTIVADRTDEGVRLDLTLVRLLANVRRVTRTRIQRWIAEGNVSINGRVTRRAARPLHAGDVVEVTLPWRRTTARHEPEDLPIGVVYEDAHLLVVSKPAGMVAHPTGRHRTGTLFNALLWHARSWGTDARPGLVHRLDRDTSGLIVVAKSRAVHARTVRLLRSRQARKRYLAIVAGDPPGEGVIALPLERVGDAPPRMGVARAGGLPSETRFEVLARGRGATEGLAVVACDLMTGRLHQIRVHLQASGWPIVGDPVYGPDTLPPTLSDQVREAILTLGRQALHAWRLALPHPVTGEPIEAEAPLPEPLQGLAAEIGWTAAPASR
jgi:23S rRNA pseudouridine1911/1915/1917 synthase